MKMNPEASIAAANRFLRFNDPNFMGLWVSHRDKIFEAKWHTEGLSKVECGEDLTDLMNRVWERIWTGKDYVHNSETYTGYSVPEEVIDPVTHEIVWVHMRPSYGSYGPCCIYCGRPWLNGVNEKCSDPDHQNPKMTHACRSVLEYSEWRKKWWKGDLDKYALCA